MRKPIKIDKNGILYLVGTPIGNLEDITLRAIRILKEVDVIAAEDTRSAKILLGRYGIHKPLLSYYDARESRQSEKLLERLRSGEKIGLISERGMPGVSDPGYRVTEKALRAGVKVIPVPGPSALIAGLVASGLPSDRFIFEGFLPAKKAARCRRLCLLREEERTVVVYESPRRLPETLREIREIMGERKIAVARELTKKFEEIVGGTVSEVIDYFNRKGVRGEIVLVIAGGGNKTAGGYPPAREEIGRLMKHLGISRMEAIKLVAGRRGLPKRELYRECHCKAPGDFNNP